VSISVPTSCRRFVCGARLFRGLQGKQSRAWDEVVPEPRPASPEGPRSRPKGYGGHPPVGPLSRVLPSRHLHTLGRWPSPRAARFGCDQNCDQVTPSERVFETSGSVSAGQSCRRAERDRVPGLRQLASGAVADDVLLKRLPTICRPSSRRVPTETLGRWRFGRTITPLPKRPVTLLTSQP
jgi:hypothetical protein